MISNDHKKLAQWALERCLKEGCDEARISIYSGSESEFEIRDRQLDKLQQSSENQLTLNLFVENRFGTFSTNRLEKEEIAGFISDAVASVRYLAPDVCRTLPDVSRCYQGGLPDLQLDDGRAKTISPDEKLRIAREAAEEILQKDSRILSVQSSYSDGESSSYLVSSNGFEGESAHSYYSLSVSVSVKGDGDARPESFWYEQSLSFDGLKKSGVGRTALERALKKIGQEKVESGRYSMLVDNMNGNRLLAPLLNAISGSALQQNNSFLLNRKGEQVLSPKATLFDDPHQPGSFGSRYFDNEGVATQKRYIFRKGVLETYFIDTYHSLKMNIEPTIGGVSHLEFEKGNRSLNEMIPSIQKGILVTGFNGGNCNSSSGDFSFGIEGFLIEEGRLTKPVTEMNVTGNMLSLWKKLEEVGNDPRPDSAYQVPSLLFSEVDFSGF